MPRIHPTATVDGAAELADDVEIGPYCLVEGDVSIGAGSRLLSHAVVRRHSRLGRGNVVYPGAVLGGEPQDLKFDPATVSYLQIGEGNVFREGVTIHRATHPGGATRVGNGTYWMVNSHAGHDSVICDEAILINGAVLAGHTELGRRVLMSAYSGVHQFCWVGPMALLQPTAVATMHVPPYVLLAGAINSVAGLNIVGMRRAGLTSEDRRQIQEAFRLTYRAGISPAKALERMEACTDWGQPADQFRQFIRRVLQARKPYQRGLCPFRGARKGQSPDEIPPE
jgi:UDP-N-acetylglucosamine acyltransferase